MVSALTQKVTESHKDTEFGSIPEDWDLLEAFDFSPYITSGSRGWARHYSNSGAPFIRIGNLSHSDIYPDLSDLRHVNVSANDPEAIRTRLEVGDILVSITADIGAIGYVSAAIPTPAYINQHIACLRLPSEKIDSRFVAYFLSSPGPQRRFSAMVDVGAKSGLNLTAIGKLKLLVPPLHEQHAIAAALSDADGLIEGLESLIAKKRAIKQGAMQELLSGRRRLAGFKAKWTECTLNELADHKKALFDDGDWIEAEHLADEGVRFVQTGNIGVGCFLERDDKKFVRPASVLALRCKFIRPGDLLICRLADPAGRACVLPDIGENQMVTSVDVTIFRPPAEKVDRRYLQYVFSTNEWLSVVADRSGGTTHKRIARGALGKLAVRLPHLEEQVAVADLLLAMDSELASLEASLVKVRRIKQGMMQELLTGRVRLV